MVVTARIQVEAYQWKPFFWWNFTNTKTYLVARKQNHVFAKFLKNYFRMNGIATEVLLWVTFRVDVTLHPSRFLQ